MGLTLSLVVQDELVGAGIVGLASAGLAAGAVPPPKPAAAAAAALQPVAGLAAPTGNSLVKAQGYKIRYITIGPVEGFG